jgi:hypothetical protein
MKSILSGDLRCKQMYVTKVDTNVTVCEDVRWSELAQHEKIFCSVALNSLNVLTAYRRRFFTDLVPETGFTNLFILFCNIKKRRNEDKMDYFVPYFLYTTQRQKVGVVNAGFARIWKGATVVYY